MDTTTTQKPSAGSSILFNATLFFSVVIFLGAFGYGIATTMSDYAKLVIGVVAVTLIIVLPFCALVIAILRRSPNTQIRVLEADYDTPKQPRQIAQQPRHALPAPNYGDDYQYRPPQPQYAEPRIIDIPRFNNMGQAQPLNKTPQLRTTTQEGEAVTVPMNYLERFARLKTPSRAEWVGKPTMYGQCAQWFFAQGFTERDPDTNGWKWAKNYDEASRINYLAQFEPEQ